MLHVKLVCRLRFIKQAIAPRPHPTAPGQRRPPGNPRPGRRAAPHRSPSQEIPTPDNSHYGYPVISFSCPRQDRLTQGKPCTSPPLPPSSPGDQSGPRRARRLGASVHHFWLSSDPDRPRPGKPHTAAHQPSQEPQQSTAAGRTIGQNPRALACLR